MGRESWQDIARRLASIGVQYLIDPDSATVTVSLPGIGEFRSMSRSEVLAFLEGVSYGHLLARQ